MVEGSMRSADQEGGWRAGVASLAVRRRPSSPSSSSPPSSPYSHPTTNLEEEEEEEISRRRRPPGSTSSAALVPAYARRLKLDHARQLHTFSSLSGSLATLSARVAAIPAPLDDDSLRPLEKESKDRAKLARQLVAEAKEHFDTQLKIQTLRDTVFVVHDQLSRVRRPGSLLDDLIANPTPIKPGGAGEV